jgi:CheY-like chemotaxis protein
MTIADSGAGIPPDLLPRVFDPYFSTKQRGGQRGMGLGLTVARSIVEQHGGTLALASTVGVGTTVTLTLPAARPAPPPAARPARARLLVMDDEPGIRTLLARALGPLGYTVDVAAHGAEAVQLAAGALAAGTPYTLALLDLTVKGGPGGVAALQALRQLDPRLRAIAVSGSPGHPEIQDPAAHGFQGALCKPFTSGDLQAALEACGG